jgi:hypothetical protein
MPGSSRHNAFSGTCTPPTPHVAQILPPLPAIGSSVPGATVGGQR